MPNDESVQGPALNHQIWNVYLAPGIAGLRHAHLTLVPEEIRPELTQFVITSILLKIEASTRIRTFNFIRRTIGALDEFAAAKVAYDRFFEAHQPNDYFAALRHLEACLASAYQGHELLFEISRAPFFDATGTGRGELNYRMGRLYNTSKHAEGFIKSSSFAGDTLSMWITNEGLATAKERVTFEEITEILHDMSLTSFIIAKSYIWTGKPIPPELLKLLAVD
jgi:hypothetical protein